MKPEDVDLMNLDAYITENSIRADAPRGELRTEAKQAIMIRLLQQHGIRTFVETGTCQGNTSQAMKPYIDGGYTIELLKDKWGVRFENDPKIKQLFGHSPEILGVILALITNPTLFWLDAHVEGPPDTDDPIQWPIAHELETIFEIGAPKGSIVLCDDIWEERFWRPYVPENLRTEWEFGIVTIYL